MLGSLRRCCWARPKARAPTSSSRSPMPCRRGTDRRPLPVIGRDRPRRHGAVLRGRDVDLGRDLAVKVLLEKYARPARDGAAVRRRGQIGGQLQHPGVVPVYDIGRFGDRPFFTMKLVKGQDAGGDPRANAPSRPRTGRVYLSIALQVAQTLAYAHAKGVIHRDLKPANIMVGAFGEVQVMDWGLAKVLAEGGIADEEQASRTHQSREDVTTIRTARSSGSAGSSARHGSGFAAGHSGLHAAGAGQRRHRPSRPPRRCLRPGCDPVRDPDRPSHRTWAVRARKSGARQPTATWPNPDYDWTAAAPTAELIALTTACLAPEIDGSAKGRSGGG